MKKITKARITFLGLILFTASVVLATVLATAYRKLPSLDLVQYYQPKIPLKIYSSDGEIIGIYGEEQRSFTKISNFPKVLKDAVIAAEDKRFYDHWGVDIIGIVRAALGNITGGVQSGASTITQQVARNFYLSNERTLSRKFNEALLAYKIERTLSKEQILELYFNQIYLGQRAYGFASAAQIYFGKNVQNLTLAEAAMLAGLPKAPSTFNPVVNPERAKLRQRYVLNNMVEEKMITPQQREQALAEQLHYKRHIRKINQNALYVAEMVRQELYEKYGEQVYTNGFRVYTTVKSENQRIATEALRKTLRNFDKNSGYRGAEHYLDLDATGNSKEAAAQYLTTLHTVDGMIPAVVLDITKQEIKIQLPDGNQATLKRATLGSAANAVDNHEMGNTQIRRGAVIRVKQESNQWLVVQKPLLQGSLISLDVRTGAIRALVGGYDFHNQTFNRATQAKRQPGSSFKPFIYSAALAKGMTMATLINDAPISLPEQGPNKTDWNPRNANDRYEGLITLRQALIASKNMVSIRILMTIGVDYAQKYVRRFGFRASEITMGLSMALGTGETTPMKMAEGYAVFANGGYKISSYIIERIYDGHGNLRMQAQPQEAEKTAPQVIDPRNAYIMYKIMQDVIQSGTGRRAKALKRSDIAGKTGTTNDNKDAWFVGFNPDIVTAVYIGYDKPQSMGDAGYGGRIALPVWIEYMRFALKDIPDNNIRMPSGLVSQGTDYFLKEQQTTDPDLPLEKYFNLAAPDEDEAEEAAGKIEESEEETLPDNIETDTPEPINRALKPPLKNTTPLNHLF